MLIKCFADVIQGHQITDEEIYNSFGNIPIFTGSNNLKGYWDKSIVGENQLPCISYPTKGNPGVVFIQSEVFDANNTALISLKEEFTDVIYLEWLAFRLPPMLKRYMTNAEGVSYLNKELVENIDLDIPDRHTQEAQIAQFRIVEKSRDLLRRLWSPVNLLLSKDVAVNDSSFACVQLNKILSYVSRNDSLSEEGLYRIEKTNTNEIISVLSGSIENIYYGEIPKETEGIHFLSDRQGLHLITRGKAGKLTYLRKGTYATNTNAFVLYLNDDIKADICVNSEKDEENYLKFLRIFLEPTFIEISSNSDVGVFPLTKVFADMEIPQFIMSDEIRTVVKKRDELEELADSLSNRVSRIESMLEKEVV